MCSNLTGFNVEAMYTQTRFHNHKNTKLTNQLATKSQSTFQTFHFTYFISLRWSFPVGSKELKLNFTLGNYGYVM